MYYRGQILESTIPFCNYVACPPIQLVSLTKVTIKYWGESDGLGYFLGIKPDADILILHMKFHYNNSLKFLEIPIT